MPRAKSANRTVNLPKGFKPITSSGDFAATWDFRTEPEITGKIVSEVRSVPYKNKTLRVLTIQLANGEQRSVWESAALKALFELKKGAKVYIGYRGEKKVKGRKQTMHDFVRGMA